MAQLRATLLGMDIGANPTLEPGTSSAASRPAWIRAAGIWGFSLAVAYAVLVRFYQAAGGSIGLVGTMHDPASAYWASYTMGLLILVGGAACLVLTREGFRTWPNWVPGIGGRVAPPRLVGVCFAAPCALGGTFSLSHGVGGILASALELMGVIDVEKPIMVDPTPAEIVTSDWWDIVFYEPWFVAMGVCLLLCVRGYAQSVGVRRDRVRLTMRSLYGAALVFLVTALISVVYDIPIVIGP